VTIRTFATGLSGKLQSGDIVSVIAADYKKQGLTVIPPELRYVEVINVTASSGYDANTGETADRDERELPSTVTLLVTVEQGKVLAELEADGKLHLSLAYRGAPENAALFIEAQDEIIAELHQPEDEDEIGESAIVPEPSSEGVEE
jgi:pilus assembly protein CpaB